MVQDYAAAVGEASRVVFAQYGTLVEVARKQGRTKPSSVLSYILCTIEASMMIDLATYLQTEEATPTVAVVHDALFVESNVEDAHGAVARYNLLAKASTSRVAKRVLFTCSSM